MRRIVAGVAMLLWAIAAPAADAPRTIEMQVDGMVCAFCMQGIEKKFRAVDATEDIFIDLERHLVAVKLKDKGNISDAELKKLLTEAGYSLRSVKRTNRPLKEIKSHS